MKKLLLSLLCALILVPQVALAYSYRDWDLKKFDQVVDIQENGTIKVTETLIADFAKDPRRGPVRKIQLSGRDKFNNKYKLRLKLLSVTDQDGKPHRINKTWTEDGEYNIQIGHPDVVLNNQNTYIFQYELSRAINYFDTHDEFYWNVFTEWEVPVLSTTVKVHIPDGATKSQLRADCFTGFYGETNKDCKSTVNNDKEYTFSGTKHFVTGEGFSIVVGWPKGIVSKPPIWLKIWWFVIDNWGAFIPFAVFFFLLIKWWKTGRDPATRNTIFPHYRPPDGLSPTEVGTIVDEKADLRDISSVIIDYAVKGYVKINETKKKKLLFIDDYQYEIEKIKEYENHGDLKPHERKILNEIFNGKDKVQLSDLKFKFYKELDSIKKKIYKDLIKDGYFAHNPDKVRGTYFGIGLATTMIPIFALGWLIVFIGPVLPIAVIISGIIIMAFSRIMPRKTLKGAKTYIAIRGLEEYIRTAEKDRIKFQEEENIFFEKLLPYAMVLGLGDKWAHTFKDLYTKPPNWFGSDSLDHFDTAHLVDHLNNFSTQANTAFASSPRSSGGGGSSAWGGGSGFSGGFSGGGFGGGGGGSW